MGCCGHTYTGKKDVKESIRKNTISYKHIKKDPESLRKWRDRNKDLHPSGACVNLVYTGKDKVGCALHPAQQGKDMREGYCDKNYLCKTAKKYAGWDKKKQEAFKKFIREKKPDWYDYSMGLDSGAYLKEFLSRKHSQSDND